MKRPVLLAALLLHLAPALAQWQILVAPGARHFHMTENDPNGRRLVKEEGWLPGVQATVERTMDDWRISLHGERFQGGLNYDGQVQSGSAFTSNTDTAQSRIALETARTISDRMELIGGIEYELWRRRVHGQGGTAGVTEHYRSWRLLAGVDAGLPAFAGMNSRLRFMLVAAKPERLDVRFDNQLFDDAHFSTKPAVGARLGLALQPGMDTKLSFTADLDWLKVRRSNDAPLLKNGFTAGTVTQPEHVKTSLTLGLRYRF